MKKKKNQNRAVTTSGSSRTVNYNLEFLDRGKSYKYQQVLCIASPMSSRCNLFTASRPKTATYSTFPVSGQFARKRVIIIYFVASSTVHCHSTLMLLEDSKSISSSYSVQL